MHYILAVELGVRTRAGHHIHGEVYVHDLLGWLIGTH